MAGLSFGIIIVGLSVGEGTARASIVPSSTYCLIAEGDGSTSLDLLRQQAGGIVSRSMRPANSGWPFSKAAISSAAAK